MIVYMCDALEALICLGRISAFMFCHIHAVL